MIRRYYPKSLWEQLPQATAAGALQQQQRATRLRTLSLDRSGAATAAAAAAGEEGSTAAALLGGSLAVLVPSYDPSKVIAGLYLLLPPPASTAPAPAAPRVTISTFVDAQSTAAVLGERVGFVRDANAREIMLAARFFARCLGGTVFAKLFDHAFRRARIRQNLPLTIGFLPRAFLRFFGRSAIIQRFTNEGAKLRVQPF